MTIPLPSLYSYTRPALTDFVRELGEPRYRADQLWHWLYQRHAESFDAMTNLPLGFRRRLAEVARLHTLSLAARTVSEDGLATKLLFRLEDGQHVETVLMHYLDPADAEAEIDTPVQPASDHPDPVQSASAYLSATHATSSHSDPNLDAHLTGTDTTLDAVPPHGRHTVCLSTQVGCAMACVFCATGQMGLVRDLTLGECVEQLVHCARRLALSGERLTNVVFMGMGEPLANWPATWGTVEMLTDPDGFSLSPRRLTISTVGIVPGIDRLAATGVPVRLAVSLHAAGNTLRSRLVGINTVYNLNAILSACRRYQAGGGRRITFEYVLIEGVNDGVDEAERLARKLAGLSAHVNLIPLNPTAGSPDRPTPYRQAVAFESVLRRAGFSTTLRMRRGIDIQAGCGQLRTRVEEGLVGRTIPVGEIGGG